MNLDRRTFAAAAAASALLPHAARAAAPRAVFPKGFLWGAATAGHQIEGNNVNSDIWLLEQVKPSVFSEPSGDACNSLELWPVDLDLVKGDTDATKETLTRHRERNPAGMAVE